MMNKRPYFPAPKNRRKIYGFSMVEVLMSLVIIAFGLLGVAGMQAVSVGNTSTSNYRSMAALQAASMAQSMSANPNYWQMTSAPASVSVYSSTPTNTVVTSSDVGLAGTNFGTDCSLNPCTAAVTMAQYDVVMWGRALMSLPLGQGQIACTPAVTATAPNTPAVCKITVTWVEKNLSQNQTEAAVTTPSQFDFQMMVVP